MTKLFIAISEQITAVYGGNAHAMRPSTQVTTLPWLSVGHKSTGVASEVLQSHEQQCKKADSVKFLQCSKVASTVCCLDL